MVWPTSLRIGKAQRILFCRAARPYRLQSRHAPQASRTSFSARMRIHWLFAGNLLDEMDADRAALGDLVPTVLACLDYDSVQQLSSVCRAAARSPIRASMLERSVLQLSSSSFIVHEMLRGMALRSRLHAIEIRDCLTSPREVHDLHELLANVRRVTFTDEAILDQEVRDEMGRLGMEVDTARKLESSTADLRRVRRRLNEQHRTRFPRESPFIADELSPWFMVLNPAALVEIDLGTLLINELCWIRRFPLLKRLQFDASTNIPCMDYLEPLTHLHDSLEQLVITRLDIRDAKEIAALRSLKTLELRVAQRLGNVEFLRSLTKLEHFVLTELSVSDLSPLLSLTALKVLTLDSIGSGSAVSLNESHLDTMPSPALPHLESLQVVFTQTAMDRLLGHCPNLRQLHLCDARLDSWAPLRTLPWLEQISINVDDIADWTPLGGLRHLKRLALDSRQGFILSRPFGNRLDALEEVISAPWDDYTLLAQAAPALRELHLLGWRSRDSSSLATLKHAANLRSLRIAFVPGPVELSTVGELHQLKRLDLWNASLVTIDFLRGMANLVELDMASAFRAGVEIISFSPLGQLTALETLVLRGRREFKDTDLKILTQLPRLRDLVVAGTAVTASIAEQLSRQYNTGSANYTSRATRATRTRPS